MFRGLFVILIGICLMVPIFSVIDTDAGSITRGEIGGFFGSERIYNSSRSLSGGMGAADLDGDGVTEVAFCDFSGKVILLDPKEDGSFKALPIWEQEGPQGTDKGLFDLVIADVLDEYPGPEMVVAGYTGNVHVLYRVGDLWSDTVIFTMPDDKFGDPYRIFEIEIADMDPAPGDEILLGSMVNNQNDPDRYLRYLYRSDSDWLVGEIELPDTVKAIDVGDADPVVDGIEIYVTTSGWNELGGTDSSLLEIFRDGDNWTYKELFSNNENLIANVRVGEIWSGHEGNELIIAGLSGWCRVLWENNGTFERKDVFQALTSSGKNSALEGLAIGDFNPLHDGDEAMVTGYYNEVTQIIEMNGEVVADLAWKTAAPDVKLELSGVEVDDVSSVHPGNEVIIASLQGWIEMLHFQEDGLVMDLPKEKIVVEADSSGQFEIEIIPAGRVNGEVTIEVSGGIGIDLIYDRLQTLDFGSSLKVPVIIDPVTDGDSEFDLSVSISVFGLVRTGSVSVHVTPSGGTFSIILEPSSLTMYDMSGNFMSSEISLVGAEGYDYIDLAVNDVDGLNVNVNSPIAPGDISTLYVSIEPGFTGSRTLTITGSHNGVPISQGALHVNVLNLSEVLEFRLKQDEEDNYFITAYLNASAPVRNMTFTVKLDEEFIYRSLANMDGYSNLDIPILPLKKGDEGILSVKVTNVAEQTIKIESVGKVKIEDDEDGTGKEWVIGVFIIVLAVITVLIIFFFYKPKAGRPEEDPSIERIGGRRKFETGSKDEPVRRGRIQPPRERRGPPSSRRRGPR